VLSPWFFVLGITQPGIATRAVFQPEQDHFPELGIIAAGAFIDFFRDGNRVVKVFSVV